MDSVTEFQKNCGLKFKNEDLLRHALIHRSYSRQRKGVETRDNERLEFLGDAVLKIIVSDYLYKKHPGKNEGDLTKIRSRLISDAYLAALSRSINVGEYMQFSFGEYQTGGAQRSSNLANALEAILGACFLDQGLETAYDFFINLMKKNEKNLSELESVVDYKSELQEWMQQHHATLPDYDLIKEEGPDHNKHFFTTVTIKTKSKKQEFDGKGKTKKQSEQEAARKALQKIKAKK